jgi:phosphatidylserine/phosphatidylglycerophosphate/cardiolipin synthase-like enzyme
MRVHTPTLRSPAVLHGLIWAAVVALAIVIAISSGCGGPITADLTQEHAIEAGSAEEVAVLALANDAAVTFELLDDDVALDARAARGIVAGRPFADLAALDAVPYVGKSAFEKLTAYALAHGYDGSPVEVDNKEVAVLALVNDPATTVELLDDDVGLDARAARNLIAERPFADLDEVDAVSYVGASALQRLIDYALAHGYGVSAADVEVVFSPAIYAASHNARVAAIIGAATGSLDIAMYSFRDGGVSDALEEAIARGVKVRLLFETANADRKLQGASLDGSSSARFERMGAQVRYVNKIMHHKFVIADGPRDDLELADDAVLATGSANWSYSAATRYDENTMILVDQPALILEFQREFEHLWAHSRDFVFDDTLPFELGAAEITDELIESLRVDGATAEAHFTSGNFKIRGEDTFTIIRGNDTVSDELVAAILGATDSIFVASGHLRSRPVAEALIEAKEANPDLDVKIYLDGQEYTSASYHGVQLRHLDECLLAAGESIARQQRCTDKGFYFGYVLGAEHDMDVRFKHYSYRWHYSYAVQMHHKYLIIDGDELWTGSYNLSDNAEHNTFENIVHLEGAAFQAAIDEFTANFLAMWETSRDDGTYEDLLDEVENDDVIPLVYTPMSLTHAQVTTLKARIRANCDEINSESFRKSPENHRVCFR